MSTYTNKDIINALKTIHNACSTFQEGGWCEKCPMYNCNIGCMIQDQDPSNWSLNYNNEWRAFV